MRSWGEKFLWWGSFLLFVGICLLFTGYEIVTPGLHIKPFDLIATVVCPVMLLVLVSTRGLQLSNATAVLGAYLVIHAWSAFRLGTAAGLRETIQSAELFLFFLVLHSLLDQIDWRAAGKLFLAILIGVAVYNAAWHISEGFYVGWKRLDEPKLAFLFLPTVAVAIAAFRERKIRTAGLLAGILLAGLVILAGERKAQIHALVLMVVLMSYRYLDPARVAVFGLVTLLIGVAAASMDPYVAQQFTSMAGLGTERYVTPAELQAGYVPTSLSNAQRVFSFGVAKNLIAANPIFGIGTDGYLEYVKASFPGSAKWLIGSIHNEFLRVLVENGALGFIAFCAIWLRCVGWFFLHKRHMPQSHAVIYLSFLSAFTMQFGFEGSGQEMFVMVIFVALMPDLFSVALKRASATERRAQFRSDPAMVNEV